MASKTIAFFLVLVMATSCLVLIIDAEAAAAAAADCKLPNLGCFHPKSAVSLKSTSQKRKMAAGLKEQKELLVGVELRKVPSGPDPLHHNGNAPKKPCSDP